MSTPHLVQNSSREFVCLNCPLPECDEGDDGCLYAQACAEPQPKRERRRNIAAERDAARRIRYSAGNLCPVCAQLITNAARACRKHARLV